MDKSNLIISGLRLQRKEKMLNSKTQYKLFGMALDPADDPSSLELKQAWMNSPGAGAPGLKAGRDPYDEVTAGLGRVLKRLNIQAAGKFPLPSWLTSRPEPADAELVTVANIGAFYDSGGLLKTLQQLEVFVEQSILPARPLMLGVDHSATAGVVSALSKKLGAQNLSVIVLDQHFDALPMSVRLAGAERIINPMGGNSLSAVSLPENYQDQLCCGNFWPRLMDEGHIRPQNLAFIGVADYPSSSAPAEFRKAYLDFEKRGCRFFPLESFGGDYRVSLAEFIQSSIQTSELYVSCDLDVGAYNFSWAARYMDVPGISAQNLLFAAETINQTIQNRGANLAGLDIMELNIHFLGLPAGEGQPDSTLKTVGEFLQTLLSQSPATVRKKSTD
jgi:arginase family enzyme